MTETAQQSHPHMDSPVVRVGLPTSRRSCLTSTPLYPRSAITDAPTGVFKAQVPASALASQSCADTPYHAVLNG